MDGGYDHLVRVIVGNQSPDQRGSVGVLLDAAFLEAVEFLAGLAIQVFAVDDEKAFFDVWVILQQCRCFEGSQRLAAAGGVPDIAVAAVLLDAGHEMLHRIDLIGSHHEQLLLAGDEYHVAADGLGERAFHQEGRGEVVEVGDLLIRLVGELVDGQETLVGVEGEVAGVVVGEVIGVVSIADDEELEEAKERLGVAVAGVVFVLDDLLHGPPWMDAEGFQLDLHDRDAVDEDEHIVTVVAVVGVDAELVDGFEGVFAPVLDVDQGVVQRCAVVTSKGVDLAERLGSGENIGGDDLVKQPGELSISEADSVQGLELLTEILLQRGAISNIRAKSIFETVESR